MLSTVHLYRAYVSYISVELGVEIEELEKSWFPVKILNFETLACTMQANTKIQLPVCNFRIEDMTEFPSGIQILGHLCL